VKAILLRSAEKMPEENYNFKPTDTVRSYGQIIGQHARSGTLRQPGHLPAAVFPQAEGVYPQTYTMAAGP
jgi:hypothetical protein